MFGMKMQQSTYLGYNWFFYFSKTSLFTQVWECAIRKKVDPTEEEKKNLIW